MKIINKKMKSTCWRCRGKGCKVCKGTGKWTESINYIIVEHNGQKYAFDSDNIG